METAINPSARCRMTVLSVRLKADRGAAILTPPNV
jgi:hypothetical protein